MEKFHAYSLNKKLIFSNNLTTSSEVPKKEIQLNSFILKELQNAYSSPIFSDYCNNICKQEKKSTYLNNDNFLLNGGGSAINTNSDNKNSSTLEIIEYPLSEKQKDIINTKERKIDNKSKDKKNFYEDYNLGQELLNYKMPMNVKGDMDDDIYLNDDDLEQKNDKFYIKNEKSKISSINENYHKCSKISTLENDDFFLNYNQRKKINNILLKTRKFDQKLKNKINNFKKLIYSKKDKKSDNMNAISNKRDEKQYIIGKKNKNLLNKNYNKKKNKALKSKEYIMFKELNSQNNYNYDNYTTKEMSISDIKFNDYFFNKTNISNNYTFINGDKLTNYTNKKTQKKQKTKKNVKNNIKNDLGNNNKNLNIINIMNSVKITKNNEKENYKINNIKNNNNFGVKSSRSTSPKKHKTNHNFSKKLKIDKESDSFTLYNMNNKNDKKTKIYHTMNLFETNSNCFMTINYDKKNRTIIKYEKNEKLRKSIENKVNNQRSINNLNHILSYKDQKVIKKKEKVKIKNNEINNNNINKNEKPKKVHFNNRIEKNNPFKNDNIKIDIKSHIKEIYPIKSHKPINEFRKISNKELKNNLITYTPTKIYLYFSLKSIKE